MQTFWQWLWLMVWAFFFVCYLLVLFQIVGDLFRDRTLSGITKAIWMIFLVLVPMATAIVYLIARGRSMGVRQAAAAEAARADSAAYIRSVAGSVSLTDQLTQAKGLLDSGAITAAEYDTIKAKVLA